jgi:hypothetical protein
MGGTYSTQAVKIIVGFGKITLVFTLENHARQFSSGKLVLAQPVKKFPSFYETRRFIAVFRRVPHWSSF